MKKHIGFLFASALSSLPFSSLFAGPIQVSGVTFSQDRATQKVTATYNLSNEGEDAFVVMDVLTNGVSIGLDKIKTVTGATSQQTGALIPEGSNKTITWDARKDWRGHLSTNATVAVTAYYTNRLENIPDVYMVVDLSEGPSATSYPVSYSMAAPDPLSDVSCVSNHLWLKRIGNGSFMMGIPNTEFDWDNATIQHSVTIENDFFAGVFEVTRAQYSLVMGSVPGIKSGATYKDPLPVVPVHHISYNMIRGSNGTDNAYFWPLTNGVAADSFMGRIRAKTGRNGFDLPTSAQWEFACRAGTTGAWNNGLDITNLTADAQLDTLGWYKYNEQAYHQPGKLKPNAWGLYDMHGNVAEWCLDERSTYSSASRSGPRGYDGPSALSFTKRVIRGGDLDTAAQSLASGFPQIEEGSQNVDYYVTGFRLFLTLEK